MTTIMPFRHDNPSDLGEFIGDPIKTTLGDWALTVLGGMLVGTLAALGMIIGWLRHGKEMMDERIENIEKEVLNKLMMMQSDHDRRYEKIDTKLHEIGNRLGVHENELGVVKNTQNFGRQLLEDLKADSREQNRKLDEILRGCGDQNRNKH